MKETLIHSIGLISKYRTEIMGYAILGVMLAHIKTIYGFPDTIWAQAIGFICYSVFTGGFFLLSGLGLHSSLCHDNNVKHFYKKRIIRLLVPYWIISTPYFIYIDLITGNGLVPFLGHVSTLVFWLYGNYSGMWYVAASVLFYVVYPFFHRLMYRNKVNPIYILFVIIVLWAAGVFLLSRFAIPFYEHISIAINKFPLFLIGSLIMLWILKEKSSFSIPELTCIIIGGGIMLKLSGLWSIVNVVSIWLIGVLFNIVDGKHYLNKIVCLFKWLGTYSLELYIMHLLIYYLLNHVCGEANQGWHIVIGVISALLLCQPIHNLINQIVTNEHSNHR